MRRAAAVTAAALAALAALSAAGSPTPPDSPLARANPWLSACDLHQYQGQGQSQGQGQGQGQGQDRNRNQDQHQHRHRRALCSDTSPEEREAAAVNFTMPHCHERTFLSALDTRSRGILRAGGPPCHLLVDDLLAVDALASRVSKDLDSVLQRYDCERNFSVIHNCSSCKDAYRQWVCGSLLPYYISENQVQWAGTNKYPVERRPNEGAPRPSEPPLPHQRHRRALKQSYELYASNNKNTKLKRTDAASDYDLLIGSSDVDAEYKAASYVYSNDSYLYNNFGEKDGAVRYNGSGGMQDRRPLDNRLGRRRRAQYGPVDFGVVRIKPCLKQCEDVERVCPYFLPGDRAPSYPTQYAGEPTFLCLDPNINETGDQLKKSNYGSPNCCYNNGEKIKCTLNYEEKVAIDAQPKMGECPPTAATPPSTCANLGATTSSSSNMNKPGAVEPLQLVLLVSILNIVYNNIVYWDTRQDASTAWTILEAVFNYCINKYTTILPCTRL